MADEVTRRLKALHDQLVADAPDKHDAASCAHCTPTPQEGASVTLKTYTEDEVRGQVAAAVDQAVGDLRTQLADLRSSQEQAAIEARIAEAVAEAVTPLSAQVTDLQTQLDAATLEAANEKARADGLQAAVEKAATDAEIASRKDDRLAKVKEAAPGFKEEYLTANAERWAAMEEAEFASRLEEYRAASTGVPAGDALPTTSALQATTGDQGRAGAGPKSAVHALGQMRRNGVDVRTI
jgi:hypothetical protein